MTAAGRAAHVEDPYRVGHVGEHVGGAPGHGGGGPASKRIVVGYGFWIFLLSDFVLFSCFFAAYAVLRNSNAGGPTEEQLFDLRTVGFETICLLVSSFFGGMASLAAGARNMLWFQLAMAVTGALG